MLFKESVCNTVALHYLNMLQLARKPEFISMEAASAILYTSLTAWSALKITGGLIITSPVNKRVLVLGSSGGVGQAAIQLLHAWGAQVS